MFKCFLPSIHGLGLGESLSLSILDNLQQFLLFFQPITSLCFFALPLLWFLFFTTMTQVNIGLRSARGGFKHGTPIEPNNLKCQLLLHKCLKCRTERCYSNILRVTMADNPLRGVQDLTVTHGFEAAARHNAVFLCIHIVCRTVSQTVL